MRRIYLDHTATTPLDPRVLEAMLPFFSDTFGNASSVHSFGRAAKIALEKSRETIADAIGAIPGEVFFTSGGTESDNFAIRGTAAAAGRRGKNHLVTFNAEHHAVLEPCEHLVTEGMSVDFLPVDSTGRVSPDDVSGVLKDSTFMVSAMHSNNEVGTINPIEEIVERARHRGVLVHTDAVQSLGKVRLNVAELGVDLMTLCAHKLYGPKGIGALYIRKGTDIAPLLLGGGQERGRRPGTENVPLAVGFAKAVDLAISEMEQESSRLSHLRDALESKIKAAFSSVIINGDPVHRLPHILNISFDNSKLPLDGDTLLMNMDLRGIAVTSGSACTSGSMQPSHVLLSMGRDMKTAKATLRFAFGKSNTIDDVDEVMRCLHEIVASVPSAGH